MTAQTTPDLGYADPPPPPDLATRARARGRALRRRRNSALTAVVLTLAGTITLGVHSIGGPAGLPIAGQTGQPAHRSGQPRDMTSLPVSTGEGPPASRFTSDGWAPGEYREGEPVGGGPIEPIIRMDAGTPQSLMWISRNGSLCLGQRASTTAAIEPSVCSPLNKLPAQGLWGGSVWSAASRSPNDSTHPIRSYVIGIVRGPVTKVVIDLPSGPREAQLQSVPGQGLGRLYWLATDDFTMAGTALGSGETASNLQHAFPTSRTVYRGDTPVFRCALDACIGQGA